MNKDKSLFVFGDVFAPPERGQRLVKADQAAGDVAYVSSTKINNGISAFISPPDYMMIHNKKLTLSNSGSVGYCFYHNYDFVASDHVTVIGLKDETVPLTENIALYLKPVFESMQYKYSFGREITDSRLAKEQLLLPSADEKPDWTFMENFTVNIKGNIRWPKLQASSSATLLSDKEWAVIGMGEIFTFLKGKRLVKADMQPGNTPFIGAISTNNGVRQLIDEEALFEGNCITVNYNGCVGEAFYQEKPFWASDDVTVLYPMDWWALNRNVALFLITVIKENRYLYSYGRKWTTDKMKNTKLTLPVDSNGSPDFSFMEQYIQAHFNLGNSQI
ncbi:MAG: restriction endonuclease subunit S [Clostridiales bacterium]|nr:restriction endonuclease subunit S [Clostridiales bacterium]